MDVKILQLKRMASYRFPRQKQRRMDELLDKGNAGKLTTPERRELDELVDEFEERTLQKAMAWDAMRKMTLHRGAHKDNSNGC